MGVYTDEYSVADKIELLPWLIDGFAQKRGISAGQAVSLLKASGALAFYDRFYGVLHSFSIEDAVNNLDQYYQNHSA